MNKRVILIFAIIIMILLIACSDNLKEDDNLKTHKDSPLVETEDDILIVDTLKEPIIIDTHNDTMMKIVDDETWLPFMDISEDSENHIDINKMKEGNLSVGFFAAYSSPFHGVEERSISRTLALINALYVSQSNNPDTFKVASSLKSILDGVGEGKAVAVPTIEGAYSLTKENAIELLHQYRDLKVKSIGFTWNYSNQLAEGTYKAFGDMVGTRSPEGLTDLGIELVKEMNRLGMIIDVSHLSVDSFFDVVEYSEAPIIASHSGVYTIKPHVRNLTDEQLMAIKENDGVVGVVLFPEFLGDTENVYIKDFVDHVDYIVELIGIDHVGLGSDFDGATMPKDLKDASEIGKIREELESRNYSQEDIEKFLGKNVLSLIERVEEIAENTQESPIEIKPNIKMSQRVSKDKVNFEAKLDDLSKVDKDSVRVILDGIEISSSMDDEGQIIGEIDNPLKEKFHVITFEIRDKDGLISRETRIFHI